MSEMNPDQWMQVYGKVKSEIQKVLVGYGGTIDLVMAGLLSGGHVLIEGAPGLGKTLLVRVLGTVLGLRFSRIQFTPDLMPADITGTNILVEGEKGDRMFSFQQGPLFANLVLADEINRATPKTQSALLEAMQEQAVTVAGTRYPLPAPFFVLATQNPIEMEGTYPLPEAQVDRFLLKLLVGFPEDDGLQEIIHRTTGASFPESQQLSGADEILAMQQLVRQVPVAEEVIQYVARLVKATHPALEGKAAPGISSFVRYGASPRAAQALILTAKARALMQGRFNVSFEDVERLAYPALRHRLILNFQGEAEGIEPDKLIEELLAAVSKPSPQASILTKAT